MPLIEFIGSKKYSKNRVTEHQYGELPNEKLDIITTSNPTPQKIAVVHIHGGGWVCGSKGNFYAKPLLKFSEAGYTVFSLNYPLAPERPHPNMLYALLKALAWIKKNHPEYDSIHKLFLKSYAGENALNKSYVPHIPVTLMDFAQIDNLPPTFIVGAGKDKLLRSSKMGAEHLRKSFNHIDFKVHEGASHGFFSFGKGCDELSHDMIQYFNKF